MKIYYDLHMHSCLSPCGDNDMTPYNLVNMAAINGLQMIALTDHNSCGNCKSAIEAGRDAGILVVPGMELCTSEEIHVVCLFPDLDSADAFSKHVEAHTPPIPNRPEIFGDQLLMDAEDGILGTHETLLVTATDISIEAVPELIESFSGACFPAHIDRSSYSILSSLGSFPDHLGFTCAEVTKDGDINALTEQNPILNGMPLFLDSDAHYLENTQEASAWIELDRLSPRALIEAINCGAFLWSRGDIA